MRDECTRFILSDKFGRRLERLTRRRGRVRRERRTRGSKCIRFARALLGIATGDEVIVVTWLHRASRDVLEVHPRDDLEIQLAGVFATRSPHRPNPLGLHRVTVHEISGTRLRIGPIEVIDGTPVVDVKPVLVECDDA